MSGLLSSLTNAYREMLDRHRNLPFLKAVMASSALVAVSDGEVTFNERVRVDQILETLDELAVFDPHEGVDLFNDYVEAIKQDSEEGREKCWDVITEAVEDADTAALMLRICLAISSADGEVTLPEQIEVVMLCSRLGVEPKDCGLYTDLSAEEFLEQATRMPPA